MVEASLSKAVRRRRAALGAMSSLVALGAAMEANAQSGPAADQVGEIVVTGTNIRRSGFQAPAPLQVVGRQQIETAGIVQFNDLLKTIPGNSGSEQFTEATPRAGTSQFNLRGLGYTSTLTLVNGRRAGISPLSDETGGEFVDINQFPLSMVQRVEVLKDGASAIYGSDAVAGVVNIITRTDLDGLELSGAYADATNQSGNLSFAYGRAFERGRIGVFGTWYEQSGAKRTDFDWLVKRVGGDGVLGRSQLINTNGAPSSYRIGGRNAQGQPVGLTGGVAFADPNCEAAGGVFRINDDGSVNRTTCQIDFADQVGIIPNARRLQLYTQAEYQLTDRVKVFSEVSFSRNTSRTHKGPGSFTNGLVTANASGNIFIPGSHPFNFFVRDPASSTRIMYIGPEAWNPAIHTGVDLVASSRVFGAPYFEELAGERRSQTDYARFMGGLEIGLGRRWEARTFYQFASAEFTDRQDYRFKADALNSALLRGTVNPFGTSVVSPGLVSPKDGTSRAANSQAVLDEVLTQSLDKALARQHVLDAIISGPLVTLPTGPVSLAVGGQYRRSDLKDIPDLLQASGRGDSPAVGFPIRGEQSVKAAYAEIDADVGPRANLQLALRWEDYGDPVGSSVDPKVAGRVSPIDGLTFRGSLGTSFQAPTIRQTSESRTRIFVNDPTSFVNGVLTCRDTGATTNADVLTRGDQSLRPQSSVNYNLGVVLQPVRGASASLDYWRYEYKDLVAAGASAQAILQNDCRDGVPNDPRIVRSAAGGISEIVTSFVNVGRVITDGFDLAASYRFDTRWGAFEAAIDATYLKKFDVYGGEGGAFDGAGSRNFANNFRTMPRWRGSTTLRWERGRVGATISGRYIGGYRNDQSNDAHVESYKTMDLSVSYGFTTWSQARPLVITVGADNVFDAPPPALTRANAQGQVLTPAVFNYSDRPGYDAYSGVDLRGRVLYARFRQSF